MVNEVDVQQYVALCVQPRATFLLVVLNGAQSSAPLLPVLASHLAMFLNNSVAASSSLPAISGVDDRPDGHALLHALFVN